MDGTANQVWQWIAWFNEPPWGLIGVLLAMIGIVMAASPFLQMIYGQPNLRLGFSATENETNKILRAEIFNQPLESGILYQLGVRTSPAEDVWADFDVHDPITGEEIYKADSLSSIHVWNGTVSQRVVLPASLIPAVFHLASFNKKDRHARLEGAPDQLPAGAYRVTIKIHTGVTTYRDRRTFRFKGTPPYLYWEG